MGFFFFASMSSSLIVLSVTDDKLAMKPVLLLSWIISLKLTVSSTSTQLVQQWAIEVEGGRVAAEKLAESLGLTLRSQVGSLNAFVFEGIPSIPNRLLAKREVAVEYQRFANKLGAKLAGNPKVSFFELQIPKKRVKRGFLTHNFVDPLWPKTWYLINEGSSSMNIQTVWQKGITGRNVVVSILDDGIEKDHPDLAGNYDPAASWDINGNDSDPSPRYDTANTNKHGTRCAGEVVAVANNSYCSVGAAFNAKIGGVRMLDGLITDAVEAAALSHNPQHIDIYSASWGPDDDGHSLDAPGVLAQKAFEQGVNKGRRGLGSIYVWASGNGGALQDSCACDGYASSIYTISISSSTEKGVKPWYLEECSSTLATTYSSGNSQTDQQIVTTDINHSCTEQHSGTSASAALAAGILALVLEANPRLTWRDVQHLIVETSRTEPLTDGKWLVNGVGRRVSNRYGFGLLDAFALVQLAQRWVTVTQQLNCQVKMTNTSRIFTDQMFLTSNVDRHCGILHLEHVQIVLSAELTSRGDLTIFLTSPSGTSSQLLPARWHDRAPGKFQQWHFTSVQFWGEPSHGHWRVEFINIGNESNTGIITDCQLSLYGTNQVQFTTSTVSHGTTDTMENVKDSEVFIGLMIGCFVIAALLIAIALVFCWKRSTNNVYAMTSAGSVATLSHNVVRMVDFRTVKTSSDC